jgi:hypothetical protein
VIEDAGETPSRTDFDQFKNVVAGVHGIKAHATTLTNVSTPKTRTVVGSTSSTASAAKALVGASSGGVASGEESMCLGTQGTSTATARNAAVIASNAGLAGAAQAVVLGCDSATASGAQSVCLGGTAQNATAARTAVVGGTSGAASAADAGTFAGDNPTASGLKAVAAGGHDLTASGENAAAIGGDTNVAAASESFCGGGNSHDIQAGATRAAAVGGDNHTISGARGIALGGSNHILTSADAVALGGANNIVSGSKGVCLGGDTNTADGLDSQCLGGDDNFANADASAVVMCDASRTLDNASFDHMVLVSSKNARLASDGDPSAGGADGYCLALGYSGSAPGAVTVNTNLTIMLAGKHGIIQTSGAITASTDPNSDFAEMFENAEPGIIPDGTLLARVGRKVRIARPGDRVMGVVSATPGILLGTGGLHYAKRYATNEFGRPLLNEDGSRMDAPGYDTQRPNVARTARPDEWTAVALVGQVRVRIGKGVEEGDYLTPGADGCALGTLARPDGRPVEVMEITTPFDAARGYGVALCLVG